MKNHKNKILVVAPHADDETMGCGGTLLKHKEQNDMVYWLIVSKIFHKDGWRWSEELVKKRELQMEKVAKEYGFADSIKLEFEATRLDSTPLIEIINQISSVVKKIEPNIVYLPNRNDVHTDHKATFDAAYSCTKNFRYPYVKQVIVYEGLSETDFVAQFESTFIPNYFVDVSKYYDKKIEIMKIYDSELMPEPLSRSFSALEAHARYRGSRIGVKYAEAFMKILEIDD